MGRNGEDQKRKRRKEKRKEGKGKERREEGKEGGRKGRRERGTKENKEVQKQIKKRITWLDLEGVMLSTLSETKKDKCHMTSLMYRNQINEKMKKT